MKQIRPVLAQIGATSLPGRVCMFLVGAVISTYCYAITIKAHIGLGPLFAFQDGVAKTSGIAIGFGPCRNREALCHTANWG